MQQLQQLELRGSDEEQWTADMVAQLFSATPEVKDLVLGNIIRQEAFDALLAHGTQLALLSCMGLELTEDRSQSACSWKEVEQFSNICCVPRLLAYLALRSLSRVCL
jgi:hypothetical protein